MASKGRWVFGVKFDSVLNNVTVIVGDDKDSGPTNETSLVRLPRHELMRVCGHLGLKVTINDSVDTLIETIVSHCHNSDNVDAEGKVMATYGRSKPSSPKVTEPVTETPKVTESPKVTKPTPTTTPKGSGVEGVLNDFVTSVVVDVVNDVVNEKFGNLELGVNTEEVRDLVREEVAKVVSRPVQIILKENPPVTITGRTHKQFESLLRKVSARRNLFLTGEPGLGKTFVIDQVAEALGTKAVIVSADPLPQKTEILGGISPVDGRVIKGAVRDAYEFGYIFGLDEWDTGHSSLGTTLNRLLSSDSFDFPAEGGGTERVKRHHNFVVIATGNTYGQGGSVRYVGTNKINGASLDRFTMFHMVTDEDLTAGRMKDVDVDSAMKVLPIWLQARRNAERYALDVAVTPRCALDAQAFFLQGDTLEEAFQGRLHGRGLVSDQERKLLDGIVFS